MLAVPAPPDPPDPVAPVAPVFPVAPVAPATPGSPWDPEEHAATTTPTAKSQHTPSARFMIRLFFLAEPASLADPPVLVERLRAVTRFLARSP